MSAPNGVPAVSDGGNGRPEILGMACDLPVFGRLSLYCLVNETGGSDEASFVLYASKAGVCSRYLCRDILQGEDGRLFMLEGHPGVFLGNDGRLQLWNGRPEGCWFAVAGGEDFVVRFDGRHLTVRPVMTGAIPSGLLAGLVKAADGFLVSRGIKKSYTTLCSQLDKVLSAEGDAGQSTRRVPRFYLSQLKRLLDGSEPFRSWHLYDAEAEQRLGWPVRCIVRRLRAYQREGHSPDQDT